MHLICISKERKEYLKVFPKKERAGSQTALPLSHNQHNSARVLPMKSTQLSKSASNESGASQQQTAPMKMKSMRDKSRAA